MSRFDFRLPDVGEGLVEAEIVAWHVAAGDRVVTDQPLVSVETDKAVVEIPAPRSGQVIRCLGEAGDRVEVGELLVELETERDDTGAVVGELERAPQPSSTVPTEHKTVSSASGRRASPAARKRARELGVALDSVEPSGPGGVIQTADVEAAAVPSAGAEALRGARRSMARRMADAGARVVPATVTGEADVTAWASDTSPLTRLMQAVAAACSVEPRLNAHFDDRRLAITTSESVDLGLAMDTEDGLFVPVVMDVGQQSVAELETEVARLQTAIAARKARPDDLQGQTITLSNFGAVAGRYATMVVVPPQVAIVGAGRIFDSPVFDGDAVRRARILPLSVTIDHRVVTGVEACRFLYAMIKHLQQEVVH